jgi:hypothetical protein
MDRAPVEPSKGERAALAADEDSDLARLAAALEETELALVVAGSHFDARHRNAHRVLARVKDPGALAELRSALRCVPAAQRMDWMTPGDPTVALFAAGRQYRAAVTTAIAPDYVRSPGLLEGDTLLAEPERLAHWLADAA